MDWIVDKMKWIMLLAGVLTCTLFQAAVAPQATLLATFGETVQGPLADLLVRNWGVLIGLLGCQLIYAAFRPAQRPLVLVTAGLSKLVFAGLVLSEGQRFLGAQAGVAIVLDLIMVLLFVSYLWASRRRGPMLRDGAMKAHPSA
jgi:hypothetical protein